MYAQVILYKYSNSFSFKMQCILEKLLKEIYREILERFREN